MKAKYLGFALESGANNFPIAEFIKYIKKSSTVPVEYSDFDRYFLFDDAANDKYYFGMVLTLKSQRKQCKAEMQRGGGIKIKTDDLANNDKIIDFNFFAINKKSLKGLYVYYHQSCSVFTLGDYLRKAFYARKKELVDQRIKDLETNAPDKSDEWRSKSATKHYKGRFEFSQLVDQRDVDKVLAGFKKIKDIEVAFSAMDFPMADGIALQGRSRMITSKFLITVQEDVANIAQAAKSIVNRQGFRRGRAKIVDDQDIERTIRLIHAPENFGEVEFEDLADKVDNLDVNDFYKNQILKDIIGIMEHAKYRKIFSS